MNNISLPYINKRHNMKVTKELMIEREILSAFCLDLLLGQAQECFSVCLGFVTQFYSAFPSLPTSIVMTH